MVTELRPIAGAVAAQAQVNILVFTQLVNRQLEMVGTTCVTRPRRAVKRDYGEGRYCYWLIGRYPDGDECRVEIQMPGCSLNKLQDDDSQAPLLVVNGEAGAWASAIGRAASAFFHREIEKA